MFTERADLAVVREAFNRAGRSFSQDLARTYVNHLVGPDATEPDLRDAYAQVAGMAAVPDIVEDLDVEAQRLVDRWFKAHRADIKTLSDARQAVYADLLSMTPQPRRSALRKPVIWQEPLTFTDKNGRKVPLPMRTDHALLSEDGTYPARLNAWERQVVEAEMTRPGAVAWFRNPDRVNVASLAVAYQDGGETWRTLRPDFIFFRRDAQGTLRASIIDPHGTHLSDALPKLQGLARFAEQYGGEFMRIEAAAQVDGVLKVLDMRDERVRDAVESAPSAAALYAGPLAHEY